MRNAPSASFSMLRNFVVRAVVAAALMTLIAIGYMAIIVPFPYPDHTPEEIASERFHMAISFKLDLAAGVAWLVALFAMAIYLSQYVIRRTRNAVTGDDQLNPAPSRHTLNAPGDFYVLNQCCISCAAPEHEAPELMAHEEGPGNHYHCYFKRQPQTPAEEERAIMAVRVGCCGAVRYGGRDSRIIKRLHNLGAVDRCDYEPQDVE